MIARRESFVCDYCGTPNPARDAVTGKLIERNHCYNCLYSKHVDEAVPGDRAAACGGRMPPLHISITAPTRYTLTHRCQTCGTTRINKATDDDNRDRIAQIIKEPIYTDAPQRTAKHHIKHYAKHHAKQTSQRTRRTPRR